MSHEGLCQAIMRRLGKGRDHAIPRAVLEDELGIFVPCKNVDREFRRAYATLPVCSCPEGLFIPETPEEVREFKEYLSKGPGGPIAAHRRVMIIYSARPELVPEFGVQQDLPL